MDVIQKNKFFYYLEKGLNILNINKPTLKDEIETLGIKGCIKRYSFDISNYENSLISSCLSLAELYSYCPLNIKDYVETMNNSTNIFSCKNTEETEKYNIYLDGLKLKKESNIGKKCEEFLSNHINKYENKLAKKDGETKRLIPRVTNFALYYSEKIDELLETYRDLVFLNNDALSTISLITTYLSRNFFGGKVIETPEMMYMRVALHLHSINIDNDEENMKDAFFKIKETFISFIESRYILASPTLFNAGFYKANLGSCFLVDINDSMDSITDAFKYISQISKAKGGVGLNLSKIRTNSKIGVDGKSSGIINLMKCQDSIVNYVNQTGKRQGAATAYLMMHHLDVPRAIQAIRKIGDPNYTVNRLNLALMIPRIFYKRVIEGGNWTMFCPTQVPGLDKVVGKDYDDLYEIYENDPFLEPKEVVSAKQLLEDICSIQRETGMPYMINYEAVNLKCNQINLHDEEEKMENHKELIQFGNLCTEIFEQSNKDEISCCNLGQVNLSYYIKNKFDHKDPSCKITDCFDFVSLGNEVRKAVYNLNKVIDISWYPIDKCQYSNFKHRPIGLGVSGFADALYMMDLAFEDKITEQFNLMFTACMYFNAILMSVELACENDSYSTFKGSPASYGRFIPDLYKEDRKECEKQGLLKSNIWPEEENFYVDPNNWNQPYYKNKFFCSKPCWDDLKHLVKNFGLYNSQLLAFMPTASTSRIIRCVETCEPQTNVGTRLIGPDTFMYFNRHMYKDLNDEGLWNRTTLDLLLEDKGSLSKLGTLINKYPEDYPKWTGNEEKLKFLQNKYKTSWEIPQKKIVDLAIARQRYICQAQSLNLFYSDPNLEDLMKAHIYTGLSGLKTSMYYLRMTPPVTSSGVMASKKVKELLKNNNKTFKNVVCNEEICTACSC